MALSRFALFLSVGLISAAAPLTAHHSRNAYDMNNPIAIRGTVTATEWGNPHIFLHMAVTRSGGHVEQWSLEMPSPAVMQAFRWPMKRLADLVETHESVKVVVFRTKESVRAADDVPGVLRITGQVTGMEMKNPQSVLFVETRDAISGKTSNHSFALGSATDLRARGWTRETLRAGMTVDVEAMTIRPKTPGLIAAASTVTLPGGRVLSTSDRVVLHGNFGWTEEINGEPLSSHLSFGRGIGSSQAPD